MTHHAIPEYDRVPIGAGGYTRAQADALLLAARAHPLRRGDAANILFERNGHLHAAQMVGVVATAGATLEILPKVDADPERPGGSASVATALPLRARLVEMLDVALDLDIGAGEAARMAHDATSLLDILIRLFAERLLGEVRRGLPGAYLAHEDDLPALRGRLDVRRQFSVLAVRPDRLACRYDVLSADTPLLQLMKACVVRVAPLARATETRRLLGELRAVLADVHDVVPARVAPQIVLDRTNSRWRGLLVLARLLLGRSWQDTRADTTTPEGVALLFPMNDLFEAYVAALASRAATRDLAVTAQGGGRFCLGDWNEDGTATRGNLFATKPDLIVARGKTRLLLIDTKWKTIGRDLTDRKRGVAQSDVYQMMAYAQLYDVPRVMLLYPHHAGLDVAGVQAWHRIAVIDGARLEIATVDVAAPRADCTAALRTLLKNNSENSVQT